MHEAPGSSPNATHKKVQLEVIKKKNSQNFHSVVYSKEKEM
jgi:hypothetical protein